MGYLYNVLWDLWNKYDIYRAGDAYHNYTINEFMWYIIHFISLIYFFIVIIIMIKYLNELYKICYIYGIC